MCLLPEREYDAFMVSRWRCGTIKEFERLRS
jgi:hypothetical protein